MSTIIGKVIDEQLEQPVHQAVVKICFKTDNNNEQIPQFTNNRGEFLWNQISPGDYILKVTADNYSSKEYSLKVCPRSAYEVLVKLSLS